VVTWTNPDSPGTRSRASKSEKDAKADASMVEAHSGVNLSIAQEYDLRPEDIYPRFVDRLGVETSPGVILIGWGEHRGVELVIDPQWVAETTYATHDIYDDSRLNRTPRAIHPRRLGLELLLDDINETLSSLWEPTKRLTYPTALES